ncbi:TRAP transporter small permease subunit [Rhodobacterales bacterium HKCCE3408]|nr:TRAP transporter small permease subunit [Rhodobacterales bacterium HKCCE3408]
MQSVERLLGWLVGLAAILGTLAIAALVGLTVVTVTFRFVGIAFPGTYVLAELLIIPAVTFSLAYAAWANAHTRVDLLTDRLAPRIRGPLMGAMLAIGAAFWGMVALAAIDEAIRRASQNETTAILDIPVAPFRWLMIAAIALLILVLLFRAVQAAIGQETAPE